MKIFNFIGFVLVFFLKLNIVKAQGTLPIYSDYLSDDIYLVHPSAAGIGNSGKLRLTHRQQWSNNDDAPTLQTISFHNRINEKIGLGGMIFNDKNGFHSQLGVQATYAYHLNFGRDDALNQVSLALSASYTQNSIDQRNFIIPDPIISQIVESDSYFNADFSIAYHNLDGFIYFTTKNLFLNVQDSQNRNLRNINLRRFLLNAGYFFGWGKHFQVEPSVMFQYVSSTKEKLIDINTKVYQTFGDKKRAWFAISYRRSLENNNNQNLSQITPIVGLEFNRYLFSYTYTQQFGDITFQNGGYHQFTLGINLFPKKPKDRGYIPNYNEFMYKNDN
jgi:type IX secretion system PorP/SprF family membrane protein